MLLLFDRNDSRRNENANIVTNPTEVYLCTENLQWKYNFYIKSSLVEILSEYGCGGSS